MAALVSACLLVANGAAFAQDLEPRAYTNLPVGLNFLVVGYAFSGGDITTEATAPLQDGKVDFHGPVLAYARAIAIRGRSAKIDVVVPYGWISGSATVAGEPRERDVAGLGDPRIRVAVNLYGAPALSLAEFADYESDLVIGASLQVGVPLGKYDGDKLLNPGTNRWMVKPQVGLSKTWDSLTLEAATALTIYTDNDAYLGGQTLRQDPVPSVQTHAIYGFAHNLWGSVDFTWYGGGATSVDGVPATERLGSTRVGATLAVPLGRYQSLKFSGSTGVTARSGSDFDAVGVAWQLRWGAGL